MRVLRPSTLLALVLAMAACGAKRAEGDAGGRPVAFHVTLDRAFVSSMERRISTGVGVGTGISSGGHSGVGVGVGVGFSSTRVSLLGGTQAGQSGAFRKPLSWGDTRFFIPLQPGRTLALTVQVEGGRQGWESIGTITIPDAAEPLVRVQLGASGPVITTTPAPAAEAGPAAPSAPDVGKDRP